MSVGGSGLVGRVVCVAALLFGCRHAGQTTSSARKASGATKVAVDAATAGDAASAGDAALSADLHIGDPCKQRPLPPRTKPLPQLVVPTAVSLPDGAVEAIDAAVPQVDPRSVPGTPICIVIDKTDGYFSWTCDVDPDCPAGAYCDHDVRALIPLGYCRLECQSDDDCGGRRCCGDTTPLTCVEQNGVRGCHCDTLCLHEYSFDAGVFVDVPSTCGPCSFWCCGAACANLANDDRNCGACGHVCAGDFPFCDQGRCGSPTCSAKQPDAALGCERCCGDQCCGTNEHCCAVPGGAGGFYTCEPSGQPCPQGCNQCMCAAADTPIDTPDGERPIESIAPGDLVFSLEGGERVVVPVSRVSRTPAPATHAMVRVTLVTGATVEMSPGHPTVDGRSFADLAPGQRLGNIEIQALELVPYGRPFTVDILPASRSGVYFAHGAAVGSTLRGSSE